VTVPNPVLVTGFEAYGGRDVNPSELVARSLEGRLIGGRLVVVRIFPVETSEIPERLQQAIAEEHPDLVICTGLAPGRTAVSLERVAVNMLDFETPDNAGEVRKNEPILRGGPDARLSPMPIAEIVDAWQSNGVPGYVSNSAGTYLCNQTLYEALGIAESVSPPVTAGFIHLPYLPEQAIAAGPGNSPSMSLELMKHAVELAIAATVPWIERRNAGRHAAAAGV
jgi:pyroglutamyl-peptidase